MPSALIINAHQPVPGVSPGRLNRTMADALAAELAARGYAVARTDIAAGYEVPAEVEKHAAADLIVIQSPVYWFGTPWIHKKYHDEVLSGGLMNGKLVASDGRSKADPSRQYGSGGKMQGKRVMLSLTLNAPREAFGHPAQRLLAGRTLDDLFLWLTAAYGFCGAESLPAFACHDVIKQPDVTGDLTRLREHLEKVL